MLRMGSWTFHSKLDERWNRTGRANVGMFIGFESVPEAQTWFDRCKAYYGDPPSDLTWGYMKD